MMVCVCLWAWITWRKALRWSSDSMLYFAAKCHAVFWALVRQPALSCLKVLNQKTRVCDTDVWQNNLLERMSVSEQLHHALEKGKGAVRRSREQLVSHLIRVLSLKSLWLLGLFCFFSCLHVLKLKSERNGSELPLLLLWNSSKALLKLKRNQLRFIWQRIQSISFSILGFSISKWM